MKTKKKIKIAVLCGGFSSESEISLKSGLAVYENLSKWSDFDVELVKLNRKNFINEIFKLKKRKIDVAFIALHGKFGEDGKLQAILEALGVKYTGCDFLPSVIAMNKHIAKMLFQANNIPTPKWCLLNNVKDITKINKLKMPVVVKPSDEGSTIGVSIVNNKQELKNAVKLAFKYSNYVIVEEFIEGKEITVPVLQNKILPMIEIVPKLNIYYDFSSKYKNGGSLHLIPPRISKDLKKKIKHIVKKVIKLVNCGTICRIDFKVDEKKQIPYVLEINTIPGMTSTSLFPEAAKSCGISFPELVRKIVFETLKK